MLRVYTAGIGGARHEGDGMEALESAERSGNHVWVDLVTPSSEETASVEKKFGIALPTAQESEEIEYTSRYWEENGAITINAYFLVREEGLVFNESLSFTIFGPILITIRRREHKAFDDVAKKISTNPSYFKNGFHLLSGIFDNIIEMDADTIEGVSKDIVRVGKMAITNTGDPEAFFKFITSYEEASFTIRENLIDKQRALFALTKSVLIPDDIKKEFTVMGKDVGSLVSHINFNFERLDYLQNIFLGYLGVQQNKVIKIFTVISAIFLPPTLIASIYGMNFRVMPELEWDIGYYLALFLIFLSAIAPLAYFQKKGWL